MKPNPVHRLPAPIEAAVQAIKLAARSAVERTVESLGLAALAATSTTQRDGLLAAQFELNRKSAVFALAFHDALDERITREVGPRTGVPPPPPKPTGWDSLTLLEEKDLEAQLSAERFGIEIADRCEWQLRELDGYMASLLSTPAGEKDRNPLRPEIVGQAMMKAVEAVTDRVEVRKVLLDELARSLGGLLQGTYADIVATLHKAGVQPISLAVRQRTSRSDGSGVATDFDTLGRPLERAGGPSRSGAAFTAAGAMAGGPPQGSVHDSRYGGRTPVSSSYGTSGYGASGSRPGPMVGTFGSVDPNLMALMRRLTHPEVRVHEAGGHRRTGLGYGAEFDPAESLPGGALPNVIVAYRDELRQASSGALDHMVIDVIGSLFDQILADPRVPPQMARQIARLQVPVLRAALGDPTFFASRRHPVRRFVNRIASLGASYDDFTEDSARRFLAKVRELVQDVVEGDFEQIGLYESKLGALEAFAAELARKEMAEGGVADDAPELLAQKEDEARLRALYAQRLEGELKTVQAPEFLREFVARTWSEVMLRAAERGGPQGELVQRMRRVGRELFVSVQPKPTPAHRKAFLAELPKLMQELTEGMNLIAWPEAERKVFFGRLMPAHAEALKNPGTTVRQLDLNLMARQVEGALDKGLPTRDDLQLAGALPVLTDEVALPRFTPEEATRVGLVDETKVDWQAPLAPDPERQAEQDELELAELLPAAAAGGTSTVSAALRALPVASDGVEPMAGKGLADQVQIGFAYQMQLAGEWQKVRLSHVSAGRTFFVFTHGGKHKKTVSLTQRMLVRLCESGRFRAYESAYLLERATARARRQLATLGSGGGGPRAPS